MSHTYVALSLVHAITSNKQQQTIQNWLYVQAIVPFVSACIFVTSSVTIYCLVAF